MAKIHNVEVFAENHYETDPHRGLVLKETTSIKQGTAEEIVHPTGTYTVGPDGSFDVPDEVADFLCTTPNWFRGPSPFAEQAPQPVTVSKPAK